MTTLRRILTVSALATMAVGMASANTILIGFGTSIGPTSTDLTNVSALLPSWDPGNASSTTTSNVSGGSYQTGISMASLNAMGTGYTLVGFNISVKETLTGDYTITNTSTNSTATGSAYVDTYTAVALNGTLSPALTNTMDPTNDLYNESATGVGFPQPPYAQGEQVTSIGGGPDPNAPSQSGLNITPGGTFTAPSINASSNWVDYGCEITNKVFAGCTELSASGAANNLLTTNLALVESANPNLTFNFSTATETDTALTGGNNKTTYATNVTEMVEVTYEYSTFSTSNTPEPTTMVLFGSALVGLGCIRKRIRKS